MKKCISVLVLLALTAAGAFALDMSAGGGLLFDFSGNNGIEQGSDYIGMRNTSFGVFGFFDITYAEFDVSLAYGSLTFVGEGGGKDLIGGSSRDGGSAIQIGFSALGKFPFDLGAITLFPLLGLNYNAVVSVSGEAADMANALGDKAGDYSQLGLLFGGGLDYNFTETIFLRADLLFQIRFANNFMDDMKLMMNLMGANTDTTLGFGPRIKVGVGFKL